MEAHQRNDFPTALVELEAAYAADPAPDLLYAIGQVHVKLDQCAEAIAFYKRYLATSPAAQPKVDTEQAIATCETKLAPSQPTATPTPPAVATSSAPWYKDKLGGVLVLTGIAAGVAGAFVYLDALEDLSAADASNDIDAYRTHVDDAGTKRMISVIFFASSGALVTAGVIRYTLARRSTEHEPGVAIIPIRNGGLVTWGGRF
ncbi:MAG: hypothetical protein ACKV2T_22335 [Kofleriaceae bacterium]